MSVIACCVEDCIYNKDHECIRQYINIDYEITLSGFYPICENYEEKEEV